VFNTRAVHEEIGRLATTLLASVERCSTPEPSTKKSVASPPRWPVSVVAKIREVISATVASCQHNGERRVFCRN